MWILVTAAHFIEFSSHHLIDPYCQLAFNPRQSKSSCSENRYALFDWFSYIVWFTRFVSLMSFSHNPTAACCQLNNQLSFCSCSRQRTQSDPNQLHWLLFKDCDWPITVYHRVIADNWQINSAWLRRKLGQCGTLLKSESAISITDFVGAIAIRAYLIRTKKWC